MVNINLSFSRRVRRDRSRNSLSCKESSGLRFVYFLKIPGLYLTEMANKLRNTYLCSKGIIR